MMPAPRRPYRFGNITVDVSNLQLTADDVLRPVEPKAFRVLQFLIEHPGRAVTKEELLAAVWADVAVTDNALTRAIAQLRKALGDDSKDPRFIETIPTVGYRFVAQPDPEPEPEPVPPIAPPAAGSHFKPIHAAGAVALLALAAFPYLRAPAVAPLTFRTNAQVTSGNGLDVNATFSPDGKLIAYASDRSGRFELYVRPANGEGLDTQVTANGGQNLFPSFSPDGQSLAFSSFRNPGIYRTPTHGGHIERLTQFGAQPVWSPDGKWIAFLSQHRPSLSTTDFYYPGPISSLWLVSASGGTPRELTPPSTFPGGQSFPSWSPDGTEIRFINYVSQTASVWTYQMESETLQKRFQLAENMTLGSACFSRDGRQLFFISSHLNGDIGVWRLSLQPSTLTPTANPELIYRPSLGSPRDLSISPDGARLTYSTVLNHSQIRLQDFAGGPPSDLIRDTGYRYQMPTWDAEGRSLLYTKLPIGRPAQAWLDPLDGTPPAALGSPARPQYYSRFIRNRTAVRSLTMSDANPGHQVQDLLLADGSVTFHQLATPMVQPFFAPDGRTIVYHSTDPNPQVWKLDLPTGQRTQLTSGPTPHGYAQLSPDSQWIGVQRILPGGTEIWVLPTNGGELAPLVNKPGNWYAGGWSPDSKELILAGNTGDGWAIFVAARQTGQLRRLTPDLPLRAYYRYPRWSPAGDRFAYEYNEARGNVFVAEFGK